MPFLPVLSRSLLGALVLVAGAAGAQAQEGGGVSYTFGIDQRLQWQDNPGLKTPAAAAQITSRTKLSFGVVTETRTQRLAFSLDGTLVAGDGTSKGLTSPAAELSYRLEGAASKLELAAFVRGSDVDTLDFVAGTDPAGAPILTSVSGTGTQRRKGATAKLSFGVDAPFGGSLSLGLTETDYTGTTDPSLIDNRRVNARLSLRFALSEVTDATAAISTSRLTEVGSPPEQSESLSLGLDHRLPNGALTVDATFSRLTTGQRRSLSLGRSLDLPAGKLSASIGVSTTAAGAGTRVIAALDWRQDLPRGAVTLGLSRAVTGNARDAETEASRLTLGLTQDLTPRLGLTANLGLQHSRDTLTGLSTRSANFDATLRYALTEDWAMNLGAIHRIRKDTSRAKSSTIFVSIGRSFEFRP